MHASARVIGPLLLGGAIALVPTPAGLPPAAWHFALAREAFAEYDKAAQKT